jgi:hypothetical protein
MKYVMKMWIGPGLGPVADFCDHDDEPPGSTMGFESEYKSTLKGRFCVMKVAGHLW